MEQLGKYRIEAKLGEGAMGFVYKAWHPGFNDYVALKTIQDTRLEGRELLERFKLEGQALAKLKHQNIVQIYDADQANGVHFIVMEYMNGGSLDRLITRRDRTVPLAKRVGYIVPVCNALDYAHKRRLFHRDIKPANIMLHVDGNEEIVKVVDFGIARLVDSSQTQTKLLIGAPAYMAPELVTATAKANEKTDIWAVGVTLYELIAYQRPFEGNSIEDLTQNIVHGQPKPLAQIVPDCPQDLAAVVEKALQKDPSARYQYVEDMLFDLEPIARRMRIDLANTLVRRAKDLIEIEEFESARSALDEARKYDGTNLQVRSLLQQVQDELRRGQLLPRLQEHVKKGRNFLSFGEYREARAAAEQAIGLDSRYEPAHKLLEEIQSAETFAEEIHQKISYARRYIAEGELTQASKLVDDILNIDADNREAAELGAKIRSLREELDRRKKLSQFLRSADELLYAAKYDECLSLLVGALAEFPGNAELQKRKDNAQAEKSEQYRLSLLNNARKSRMSQQFEQALGFLDELLAKFPGDSTGVALRSSIQKERDQERLNKQLGQAWEELRSLKHQGKFSQALARAGDLAAKYPSEERIKEFVKELQAEIKQNKLHTELDAAVNRIQELIRNGSFSQALHAVEQSLKLFPNNPLLVSLQGEAKSQQQRKQALEKQNDCLGKVRDLISAERFKEAADLARKGLTEFGEHNGLREGLADAERYHTLQAEKNRERELIVGKIQESCEQRDVGGATLIFQDAIKEGVIAKDTALHATLLQKIEKAKEQEQKEREVQIELRRREVRKAVDRKEFSAAIHLANELERDFGLDREASDLRRIAETSLEAERMARQERDEVLQRATNYLNSGNIAAADQILRNSLETGILAKSDSQAGALIAKTKELLDRDKERKKRLQSNLEGLRKLMLKRQFAAVIESGQEALKSEGHHEEIADLVKQAKIALDREESLQRRRLAELRSVRGLVAEGDPQQAKTLLRDALQQGVLDGKDQEVVEFQRQIEELIRVQTPTPIVTEPAPERPPKTAAEPGKTGGKRWILAGVSAGVLAAVVGGAIVLTRSGPHPAKDSDETFWNSAEKALSRSPKDFKEALDDYERVADLHGAHHDLAQSKIADIKAMQSEEEKLFQQAQQALDKSPPNYSAAIGLYDQIVKIDGDRKGDAQALRSSVEDLSKGMDLTARAKENLGAADQLVAAGKWGDARRMYELVGRMPGISAGLRTTANEGFKKADLHVNEEDLWNRAVAAETENRLGDARGMFAKVVEIGLGHKVEAEGHLKAIDSRMATADIEKKWADLKGRVDQSKDSQDREKLLALRAEIRQIMSANGPHSADARESERVVSESLTRLDVEESSWKSISEQYTQAVNAKDRTTLAQLPPRLKPYMNGGPHAQEARDYAANIERVLSSVQPPPPPEQPTQKGSCALPEGAPGCNAIKDLVEVRLTNAFDQRNLPELQGLWPALSGMKDSRQKLKAAFDGASKFSRRFTIKEWKFLDPNQVRVSGSYAGEYVGKDGTHSPSNGEFDVRVIRDNGRWIIKDIIQ